MSAALAVAAAAPALAAGPAKAPDPPQGGLEPPRSEQSTGPRLPGDGQLLVTFADTPTRAQAQRRLAGVGSVSVVAPEAGVWGLTPSDRPGARERALRRPGVSAVEWSQLRSLDQAPAPVFGDPGYATGLEWGLLAQGGPPWAPALTVRLPRVPIAILDSGVDVAHEEWTGPASPLAYPRSTVRNSADVSDWGSTGHGTHVAGIAAAPANGLGIVGVSPAVRGTAPLMPVQIALPNGRASDASMIEGIRWAVNHGARVINISAGGPGASPAFQQVILWATQKGALVVASVGNDGTSKVNYPAAYKRVIGVGAQCDANPSPSCPTPFGVASFSNRNQSVDVVAPGVNILSSIPAYVTEGVVSAGYGLKSGTSMAAPYVAGTAALAQAANGNALSPFQLRRLLQDTAIEVPPAGRDTTSGFGLVNPLAAATRAPRRDDAAEVNDDVRWLGAKQWSRPKPGRPVVIDANVDQQEDRDDVYEVRLRRGERIRVVLTYRTGQADLYLWGPGTATVETSRGNVRRNLLDYKVGRSFRKAIDYTASRSGRYFVNVYGRSGRVDYRVAVRRR